MQKIFFTSAIALTLIACGGSGTENKEQPKEEPKQETAAAPAPSDNPDYAKGLTLIAANDCLTCHKVDEKLVGPSYRDVANKYESNESNIKMLAEKVTKGGTGVWGEVPMAPHPALSQADAEQMVKYILLLKNK